MAKRATRRTALQALDVLNAYWQRDDVFALFLAFWADAKRNGFDGTPHELRAQFEAHVRQARALESEMRAVEHEYSPHALLSAIRELGGLRPFTRDLDGRRMRGDLASIVESFSARSTWGQSGGASIFRRDGLAIDDLLGQLKQDARWSFIQDENDLLDMLDDIAREGPQRATSSGDLAHFLRATGVDAGAVWWSDNQPITEKPCRVCGVTQPVTEFCPGLYERTMCRGCRQNYRKALKARHSAA